MSIDWSRVPEWALVLVTGFLAVYTYLLWKSTSNLARDAKASADATLTHLEATAERQLRAYLLMEEFEIHRAHGYQTLPDLPQLAPYRAVFKNSGQTPAYDIRIEAGTFLEHPELAGKEHWSFPAATDTNESRGTLAPGGVIYQFYDETLKADELQLLRDGVRRVFFAGSISYNDAFSKSRRTIFRLMREPGTHAFIACERGNIAD